MTKPAKKVRPTRDTQMTVRVTKDTHSAVEAFASENGYSMVGCVNRILMDWQKMQSEPSTVRLPSGPTTSRTRA